MCLSDKLRFVRQYDPDFIGRGFYSEVVKLLNLQAMQKNKGGSGGSKDTKTYRYTFRLNETQNAKFLNMLDQSGETNKSKFILSRIFG